jgi:hypothetical protein
MFDELIYNHLGQEKGGVFHKTALFKIIIESENEENPNSTSGTMTT